MKKIILQVILLTTLLISCAINKKDETNIDKEKYMPKKLIFSTLPDDYPKELDELFKFYYDFTTLVYNENQKIKKQKLKDAMEGATKLGIFKDDYIASIPMQKVYRLFYLDNLAKHSIPNYYLEYFWIISEIKVHEKIFLKDYYPKMNQTFFNGILFKEHNIYYVIAPNFLIGKIANRIAKEMPEISILKYRAWVKAKVIFNEKVIKKNMPIFVKGIMFDYDYYTEIQVLDSPGVNFKNKKLLINSSVFNRKFTDQPKLERGETYLIPLKFYKGAPIYEKIKLSDGEVIDNNRWYLNAGLVNCFDIDKDGYCHPRGTTSVFKRNVISIFGDSFKYDDFKKRIKEIIKTIKNKGGIK